MFDLAPIAVDYCMCGSFGFIFYNCLGIDLMDAYQHSAMPL